jgi:hypothetical protein
MSRFRQNATAARARRRSRGAAAAGGLRFDVSPGGGSDRDFVVTAGIELRFDVSRRGGLTGSGSRRALESSRRNEAAIPSVARTRDHSVRCASLAFQARSICRISAG